MEKEREVEEEELEIPTPVTILWEDILMAPIVGVIGPKRAQQIMEALLTKISDTESKIVLLDITGVATMDSSVANHLIKITRATKLMGCQCIISGISPAVAQTMVRLGVETRDVITTATLRDALMLAFEMTGFEVKSIKEAPKRK